MRISDWVSDVCSSDFTCRPGSERSEQDSPSILGSATSATVSSSASRRNRRTRATNSSTSSSEKALSRLIIGRACATLARCPAGAAPTSLLGDSVRIRRSEEHTSELQSLMRISYAVFCLKKKQHKNITQKH